MWFKTFNKEAWNLRMWRRTNLYFNSDDIGLYSFKAILRYKDLIFRTFRHEGTIRGFNFFFITASVGSLIWVKTTYYDPKYTAPKKVLELEKLKELDIIADKQLFKNRLDSPTRPHRSLEDILAFLSGSATYDKLADFLSYDEAQNVNSDHQQGLDSWMSVQDRRMLKYYQKSMGRKIEID